MNKSKIKTVALGVVLIALGICAWLMFNGSAGIGLSYPDGDKYTAGDVKIPGPVENLNVDWTEGTVNVVYYSGSEIIVSETSPKSLREEDRLRWWMDGTTLRIRYAKSGIRLSSGSLHKALTVSLPEGTVLKTADISATSADLEIARLAAEAVILHTTSGDIKASTAASERLETASTSGSVSLSQEGDLSQVNLSSTSGSISCTLDAVKEFRGESTSGSIFLDAASVGTADLSSTSGGATVRTGAFTGLNVHSTSGSVRVYLPAEPGFTCEVSTASGSVSNEIALAKDGNTYKAGDGSGRCSLSTTSGDIVIGEYK